ncbi:GNAT family N-acetyltransferase [Singulisphaera acidiphila]|uniref:Acetyltransferase n=1 Tax=Singulisphaera acidiphila (strain ATCC BAA-1392 / DSM 18658 / VKM B-2454 / MOB10) TaxID=886293 RepID=L0DPA1_SINAD|nr:GNAT family N-acetyltransferase [Singulisphaera acidiphila]AGA30645.1 acetyltransferase [Singulisphaera acidiphila DSM 18658]
MVSIRTADIGDAGVLADLGRQTFHETFAAQNSPEDMDAYMKEAFTVGRLTAEIREPGAVYLVAEAPPRVIGFARVAPADPPACITGPSPVRLVKLYVSADAIGLGVGAALMRSSIEWAKNSGHKCLWLGVWEHNHRAKAFYERWRFVPVGTEMFRLGNDDQTDVLMQLMLSDRVGGDHPGDRGTDRG